MDPTAIREQVQAVAAGEQALQPPDATTTDQPISDSDLWRAVNSGEDGDAFLFTQVHRDKLVFDHAAGTWYEWQGHYWAEDNVVEHMAAVDAVIDAYGEAAQREAWKRLAASKRNDRKAEEAAEQRENAYLRRVGELQRLHRKRNVLTLAAAGRRSLGITGDEWDQNPWLMACPNGTVDLQTGKIRPGRQDDFLKTVCPTAWRDLDAKAPAWIAFLTEIMDGDQELVGYLQRLLGYAITGLSTEHVFPILWGAGRNGKGTLLQALADVLGPLAGPCKSEMLLEQGRTRSSAAPDSDLMALRGKRVVWASETDEGRKLNAGRVKWLVGGDTLVGRAPFAKREITFKPTHTLLLLTNHKPKADPTDYALWQRVHLIPFALSFVDEPHQANERKRDPYLIERLRAESSGILAWLVRGCLAWQREGLRPP
ncbi:MAG TPA: phage/plasmid primase, P4 family, partial [Syntrophobacteraceae bacterium]|nr:phage/plasmid primase, P4 family [Syntrophobacteraceae bacterium]